MKIKLTLEQLKNLKGTHKVVTIKNKTYKPTQGDFKTGNLIIPFKNSNGHDYDTGTIYVIANISDDTCRAYPFGTESRETGNNLKYADSVILQPYTGVTTQNILKTLVLPPALWNVIYATIAQENAKNKKRLWEDWGFGATIEKGRGAILLFYGPPGTGKTMTAQAIAEGLKKDFMMLGSKDFQSSIPGDTERKMVKAFEDAKEKDMILILDECDSVLYDRNQVGSILSAEINCLMGEIEKFDGICVLTTNRLVTLDPALERRVALKLEFVKPDKTMRSKIWRNLIPEKAPLDSDVNLEELAEYELTGGQIKNAILTAARLAIVVKQANINKANLLEGIKYELLGGKKWEHTRHCRTLATDTTLMDVRIDKREGIDKKEETDAS